MVDVDEYCCTDDSAAEVPLSLHMFICCIQLLQCTVRQPAAVLLAKSGCKELLVEWMGFVIYRGAV